MTITRLKGYYHDEETNKSYSFHDTKWGPYFSTCVHMDEDESVSIFVELFGDHVYREAIFSPLEQGEYKGMDGGLDIAHPPYWRRTDFYTHRFKPNIEIFGGPCF